MSLGLEAEERKTRKKEGEARARVCIIDPDENVVEDFCELARAIGCEARGFTGVLGVSNQLRVFQPDILVVDINMPVLSGTKLIEVLRRNLERMPVLILYSDLAEEELKQAAREAKADDYVEKNGHYLAIINRLKFHLNLLGKN